MKKILLFAFLLIFALSLTACTEKPTEGLAYTISKDGASLSGIGTAKKENNIIIPSVYGGKKVTAIAANAFKDCLNVESVTIPASVKEIDPSAFAGCDNLTTIVVDPLNKNFTAKDGCVYTKDGQTLVVCATGNTATKVTVTDGVTSIGKGAFEGCKTIESVTLPNSLLVIEDYAFAGCTALKSINIPDSVTIIGNNAFFNCEEATELTIGNSVTSIGVAAFAHCVNIETINYNAVSVNAFSEDNQIFMNVGKDGRGIDLVFGAKVETLPSHLFATSSETAPKLVTVKFTNAKSCTVIGVSAFKYCNGITELTVSSEEDFAMIEFRDDYSNPLTLNVNIKIKESKK